MVPLFRLIHQLISEICQDTGILICKANVGRRTIRQLPSSSSLEHDVQYVDLVSARHPLSDIAGLMLRRLPSSAPSLDSELSDVPSKRSREAFDNRLTVRVRRRMR